MGAPRGSRTDQRNEPAVSSRPIQVQVIATTEAGTRAALREVRRLSGRLGATRAVLLIPRIRVGASTDANHEEAEAIEGYRHLAEQTGVDVTVRLCLCGGYADLSRWMLPRGSMVVVGGRRRWWWPTAAERIADRLKRAGYVLVFADESRADHA